VNKFYWFLCVITAAILYVTVHELRKAHRASRDITYQDVLGKSLDDKIVLDFIASNNCARVASYHVCRESGIALWLNSDKIVKTIYLYSNNPDGFAAYKGELPFGLKFYDTQGAVEYKLKRQGVGNQGLPDEGNSLDHFHYRAVYKKYGITIMYNSPFPDENATIYAIVVNSL